MRAIIILLGIMLIWSLPINAQETGTEHNNSFSKICERQMSVLKQLSFNKDAGPLQIAVADGSVQAELDGKVFFSESLPKDWKKDDSGPRLSGALVGDKYLFVAEKLSGKTELFITDVNRLIATKVDMPGTIVKIVFLDDTGQILVKLKETTNVTMVFFNAYGDPVTITVN